MPKIVIELTTGDNTLVGVTMRLSRLVQAEPEIVARHLLQQPVHSNGKFVFTSVGDLPPNEYRIYLKLTGAGRSASIKVRDAELTYPEQPDWPFKLAGPGVPNKADGYCYFQIGAAS